MRRESPLVTVNVRPTRMPAVPGVVGVSVGIDAAIAEKHHVSVRETTADGAVSMHRFVVPPTLTGLSQLSRRLARYPGVVAVAEPTSMTWLPLALSLSDGGGRIALVGTRHSTRLRG